jgi:lipopolysaccharide/colanic/teichoic acid biosynthesis glycosyltransferase
MSGAASDSGPRDGLPRVAEIVMAAVLLVVIVPLLVIAVVAIVLDSRGSPFFLHERVGRGGRRFLLWKLRTMRAGDGPEVTVAGDCRVTRVGRFLRRSKLDELPQLWNVLRGDMSFVGPRPEVPSLVDKSNDLWRTVLAVRPGITDPVALELRDEESLLSEWRGDRKSFYRSVLQPYKLKGYVAYLQRRTACSDMRVIVETILVAAGIIDRPRVRLRDLEASSSKVD